MKKTATIIVLCYNHEKYIRDTLESILNQTYSDIQILINDDCSTDNSWSIVLSYKEILSKKYKDISLHRNNQNIGITKSLNNALKKAKGEVIKLIAGDDFLECSYIENVADAIFAGANTVMTNAYYVSDGSTYEKPQIMGLVYKTNPMVSNKRLFERIFAFNFICAPSFAFSRRIFDDYGLFDESLPVEDLEYWLRITKDDKIAITYLEEPLVYYRKSVNSMTSIVKNEKYESRNITMYSSSISVRKKYKHYLPNIRYKIVLTRLICSYMKKAKEDNLLELQKICYSDTKELGLLIGPMVRILFRLKII